MKLELKHLTPYLPYSLRIKTKHGWDTMTTLNEWQVNGDHEDSYSYEDHPNEILEFKPILRPLSDLTKVIKHNRDEFIPYIEYNYISEFLEELSTLDYTYMDHVQYKVINVLFELHFDVFGLIEKGLAVNINTIKN